MRGHRPAIHRVIDEVNSVRAKMCHSFPVFFFAVVFCWIVPLQAQQQEDLRGVWQMVSYIRDGRPVQMEARMFLTSRHFTRVMRQKNRKDFGFDFRQVENLTPEQHRAVAEAAVLFNAATGTYRIEQDAIYFKSVLHHNPAAEDHEAKRNIEWKADRLRLYRTSGSGLLEEIWERVEKF